jgi:hypothetical protein|tara:strand:+ start:4391 stop:4717 length:327 start_codon:yes stop_codon:yes gene_type:complete
LLKVLLKVIGSLIFGALVGFIGVILHNAFAPVGIFLALITTLVAINFAGHLFGSRSFKVIAAVAWLLVALRAGTYGQSEEILIISNLNGNLFLLGGLLIVVVAALRKV